MEAVILAGGFATRLYPLTKDRAKPLLDVGGKSCMQRIVDKLIPLKEQGLSRILVVANSRFCEDFKQALAAMDLPFAADVIDNGVMDVNQKRGAVGDMAFAAEHLTPGEDFWVLAGDNLFEYELDQVWDYYLQGGRKPLVLLSETPDINEARLYNNLELDDKGIILDFQEKPANPWSRLFAVCIYTFPAQTRQALATYLGEGNNPDNAGSFIAWLARKTPTATIKPEGAWFDIGSVQELELAGKFFRDRD